MAFDGIVFSGEVLRIRRPHDYNATVRSVWIRPVCVDPVWADLALMPGGGGGVDLSACTHSLALSLIDL